MRELKFRALKDDISNCNFIYGMLIYSEDKEPRIQEYDGGLFITCLEGTEGQFTGLKDKQGKEIYEGDILKIPDDWDSYGWMAGEIREVYYLEGSYRLKPKQDLNGRGHLLDNEVSKFEVIGNIYQNKDLIKKQ